MRFEHQRGDLAGGSFVGGHPRRTLRTRGEVDRLCCRSTASVRTGQAPFAPGAGAPTEGERLTGFVVGAPPRCEPAGTLRTRGGCSYGDEGWRVRGVAHPRYACSPGGTSTSSSTRQPDTRQ